MKCRLELLESLGRGLVLGNTDDVESDSLGQWAALTNSDGVTVLDSEGGGAVGREVLVSLLVTPVLGDARGQRLWYDNVMRSLHDRCFSRKQAPSCKIHRTDRTKLTSGGIHVG